MNAWVEADYVNNALRERAERERMERENERKRSAKKQLGLEGRRPIVRHVARVEKAYTVKMKNGEQRDLAPGKLWRHTFGASTLKRLMVRVLCGDLVANEETRLHRTTVRVKHIGCEGCRVLLDEQLEKGRMVINARRQLERVTP